MSRGRILGRVSIAALVIASLASPISAQDYYYRYKGTWGASGGTTPVTPPVTPPAATVTVSSGVKPNVGQPFTWPMSASGANGAPIAGYAIDPVIPEITASGTNITGTLASAGSYTFQVVALDSEGDEMGRSGNVTLEVLPPVVLNPLPDRTFTAIDKGSDFSFDFKTLLDVDNLDEAVTPVLTWTKTPADQPPGLALGETTGILSGKPTQAGTYNFQVAASGYDTTTGPKSYTINVNNVYLDVTAISAGNTMTCAVTTAGGVKCWGNNSVGQLGDGTTTASNVPVQVQGLESGVSAISVGGATTCVIQSGAMKCWGGNTNYQVGDGTNTHRTSPVTILSSGVSSISVGNNQHTCAVHNGAVKCWGYNGNGQVDGSANGGSIRQTPHTIIASGATQVSAGHATSCAVVSGSVQCWGHAGGGIMANTVIYDKQPPTVVSGLTSPTAVAMGEQHACAIHNSGAVRCWGYGTDGQLGNGLWTNQTTTVPVNGLNSGVTVLSSAPYTTCAVHSGALKCWGRNNSGQIGNGNTTNVNVPYTVFSGASEVEAGVGVTCGKTTAGRARCWGNNSAGALGDGTNTNRLTPVDVLAL